VNPGLPAPRPGTLLGRVVGYGVLLFIVQSAWVLAAPLFAGPDEPAQIVKAAAVVRGELIGHPLSAHSAMTEVSVPRAYGQAGHYPLCYALSPRTPASCMGRFPPPGQNSMALAPALTYVGRYPPAYYAIVGWPTLLFQPVPAIYLMRLTSALASAFFFAVAFAVATSWGESNGTVGQPELMLLGVALATSPAVLFQSVVVNPNGLEISAACATWVCLARLATDAGTPQRHLVWLAAASASVAGSVRGLSPLWVGVIVAICALLAGRDRLAELAADRSVRLAAVVTTTVLVAATAWIALAGSLDLLGFACRAHCPGFPARAWRVVGLTWQYLRQMVGVVGWVSTEPTSSVDTSAPAFTYATWFGLLGLLVLAPSLGFAPRNPLRPRKGAGGPFDGWGSKARQPSPLRELAAVLSAAAATVALPMVVQGIEANSLSYIWQGRYILPVAVGVPVLAGLLATRCQSFSWAAPLAWLAMWGASLAAFAAILRRWTVGVGAHGDFLVHPSWHPPLSPLLLVISTACSMGALYAYAHRMARRCAAFPSMPYPPRHAAAT